MFQKDRSWVEKHIRNQPDLADIVPALYK